MEAYHLGYADIADLTDAQILSLCGVEPAKPERIRHATYKDWFTAHWKRHGLSDDEIEAKYQRDFPDGT